MKPQYPYSIKPNKARMSPKKRFIPATQSPDYGAPAVSAAVENNYGDGTTGLKVESKFVSKDFVLPKLQPRSTSNQPNDHSAAAPQSRSIPMHGRSSIDKQISQKKRESIALPNLQEKS